MALEITRSEAEGILSWIPRLTYNEKNAETAENYYFFPHRFLLLIDK